MGTNPFILCLVRTPLNRELTHGLTCLQGWIIIYLQKCLVHTPPPMQHFTLSEKLVLMLGYWTARLEISQGQVVQSLVRKPRVRAKIKIQIWKLEISKFTLNRFVHNLLIGCSNKKRESYLRKFFWAKETQVSTNWPLNKWTQNLTKICKALKQYCCHLILTPAPGERSVSCLKTISMRIIISEV